MVECNYCIVSCDEAALINSVDYVCCTGVGNVLPVAICIWPTAFTVQKNVEWYEPLTNSPFLHPKAKTTSQEESISIEKILQLSNSSYRTKTRPNAFGIG